MLPDHGTTLRPRGLIFAADLDRGQRNCAVLALLALGRVPQIEVLGNLNQWKHSEPPAFINVAGAARGGPDPVRCEAIEMCARVRDRWPEARPHVGLVEDHPGVAVQLFEAGAYDVFLDVHPICPPGAGWAALPYNPAERARFLSSVDRSLGGYPTPRPWRLTGEHVPQEDGEWCLVYDRYTPLMRERRDAMREVIVHCRGRLDGLHYLETSAFGPELEHFEAALEQAAVVYYLILPNAVPFYGTREGLVRRLESLGSRTPRHAFHDRTVCVLYVTAIEGEYPEIPTERRFRCGSNIALVSLLSHALHP